MYFHAHARRRVKPNRIVDGVALSPRELECLEWAAKGKSAWETGQLLNVTRRTAAFHLDNAKMKLGVRTICQAVANLVALKHPEVVLTMAEMNEWEIQAAVQERRVDVALMTSHTLWPDAVTAPRYRERIVAAMQCEHPLAEQEALDWERLRKETFLVQGWDNSQSARAFLRLVHGLRPQIPVPCRKQTERIRTDRRGIRDHVCHH
jgi:DNA-binding CsgD family transcriptional regulator